MRRVVAVIWDLDDDSDGNYVHIVVEHGVTEDEVEQYHVTDIPTAYPVYELNFEDHLIPVLEGVHLVPNLLTLGRHGLFLNNSMDDNVLLGMKVGDHIAGGDFNSSAWLSQMLAFMHLRFDGK